MFNVMFSETNISQVMIVGNDSVPVYIQDNDGTVIIIIIIKIIIIKLFVNILFDSHQCVLKFFVLIVLIFKLFLNATIRTGRK